MGRSPKPWPRKDRGGWWCKLNGEFIRLGETEREAWVELNRILSTRGDSTRSRSRLTAPELIDFWLDALTVKPVTRVQYLKYANDFANHAKKVVARDVKPLHVTSWLKSHPTWVGSRSLAVRVVKLAWRWAKDEGWIEDNPLAGIRAPSVAARAPGEIGNATLLPSGVCTPSFLPLLAFMLGTGCRPGEARTLLSSRVDLEKRITMVEGKKGIRPVVLSDDLVEILRPLCALRPDGTVFVNSLGKPWSEWALRSQFREARKRAGAGNIVPYHCRGIWASKAHAAGVDAATIATALGHKDVSRLAVLIKHYLSVDEAKLRDAVERVSAAGKVAPPPIPPGTTPGTDRDPPA